MKEERHKHDSEAVVNVAEVHAAHNLHSTSGCDEWNILNLELALFCLKINFFSKKFICTQSNFSFIISVGLSAKSKIFISVFSYSEMF